MSDETRADPMDPSGQVAVLDIEANAIGLGTTRTPTAEAFSSDPEAYRRRLEMIDVHRIGKRHEVAQGIAVLRSDVSSYLSAPNVEADGGPMQMVIEILPRPGVAGSGQPATDQAQTGP